MRRPLPVRTPWVAVAVVALGCLGRSPVVSYYTMGPVPGARAALGDLVVGLGPVTVPEYLDRPQLVTREGASQLAIDDAHRWAGGFQANLRDALADDLRARLGTDLLFRDASLSPTPVAFQVAVDVRRFEGSRRGDLELRARWLVRETSGARRVFSRETSIRQEVTGGGVEALVAAHDAALGRLADEIAERIRRALGPGGDER